MRFLQPDAAACVRALRRWAIGPLGQPALSNDAVRFSEILSTTGRPLQVQIVKLLR